MKVKSDFVTNSSSSSFVAWGVPKDDIEPSDEICLKQFQELLKKTQEEAPKYKTTWRYDKLKKMLDLKTDEEKIDYIKDEDDDDLFAPFNVGGVENNFVGLCPTEIEKDFPEVKFGEIRTFMANMLNKYLGTAFTEKDIQYYEEGWYDG